MRELMNGIPDMVETDGNVHELLEISNIEEERAVPEVEVFPYTKYSNYGYFFFYYIFVK